MPDDIDDFLGIEADHEQADLAEEAPAPSSKGGGGTHKTAADATVLAKLAKPVSISFLSMVWRTNITTAKRRLSALAPIAHHRGNQPLYDFVQASQYLVKPRVDMREFVKKMDAADLPTGLQKDVWDARLKEQKWRQQAGDLWPTESVLEVLGETFQRLKTTTQLWVDQISEGNALSTDARTELQRMVDGLQKDLHKTLVELPKERATPSQLGELPDDDLLG